MTAESKPTPKTSKPKTAPKADEELKDDLKDAVPAEAAEAVAAQAAANAEDPDLAEEAAKAAEAVRSPDGEIAIERLIREGEAFLGHPPHVVAGALNDSDEDALTPDEARARVQAWLGE